MCEKRKMLIVDDLDLDRDILKELFENEFDILEAVNGQKGIDLIKQYGSQISIVLLDIHMPVMSGIQVLKYRNTDPSFAGIPVIVITINDDTKTQMETFRLGATDYITKPFMEDIIRYRINNVLSTRQVEEVVRERENLRVKAELDLMTGLHNKVTAQHLISNMLTDNHTLCAMLVVDIDDFKQVNDVQGHLAGDRIICMIAKLLSEHFRKTDVVGRIGGDEFLVFMQDLPSADLARKKASNFSKLLKYTSDATPPANISVSIGLAISEKRPYTYEELFKQADQALYNAKRNGKGQYAEYGVEKTPKCFDKESFATLLLSKSREVRSAIDMISENTRLLAIRSPKEANYFKEDFTGKVHLIYIDLSTESENESALIEQMLQMDWLQNIPFIAICKEGNIRQYSVAIQRGAVDILPAPIDTAFAKRRVAEFCHIEK